jgi:hypothetical protein
VREEPSLCCVVVSSAAIDGGVRVLGSEVEQAGVSFRRERLVGAEAKSHAAARAPGVELDRVVAVRIDVVSRMAVRRADLDRLAAVDRLVPVDAGAAGVEERKDLVSERRRPRIGPRTGAV